MARIALATIIGTLAALAPAARSVRAQTVDPVQQAAEAVGGQYTGCLEAITMSESHDDPDAYNPTSGAVTEYQFTPSGVWTDSPLGRTGLPPTAATLMQRAAMAVWALSHNMGSAWSASLPAGCS